MSATLEGDINRARGKAYLEWTLRSTKAAEGSMRPSSRSQSWDLKERNLERSARA
jgi:hypothetical protein